MPAGIRNLIIEQGATFSENVAVEEPEGTPKDLTGWTIAAKVRAKPSDTSALLTFQINAVDLVEGIFQIYAAASSTATLPTVDQPKKFYPARWDCEISSGATVIRLLEGDVEITPEITK